MKCRSWDRRRPIQRAALAPLLLSPAVVFRLLLPISFGFLPRSKSYGEGEDRDVRHWPSLPLLTLRMVVETVVGNGNGSSALTYFVLPSIHR